MLSGLGLLLAADTDVRDERDVNVDGVVLAENVSALTDGFEERRTLDVAHRTAHVDDYHVALAVERENTLLDVGGDVRHDLHRRAVVLASSFLGDDVGEHLTGGDVVLLAQVFV